MARGRKVSTNNPILTVVLIVLAIVAVVVPLALLISYCYYRYKLKNISSNLSNSISDFWLKAEEKKIFKENVKRLASVEKKLAKTMDKGIKAGLSVNMDGSFSARSNIGKEIRSTLEQYNPERSELATFLDEMSTMPANRWNELNTYAQRAYSCFWAFFCWLASFTSIVIISYLKQVPTDDAVIRGIFIASGVAFVSFFIFYFVGNNRGNAYSPLPPEVTQENVDFY